MCWYNCRRVHFICWFCIVLLFVTQKSLVIQLFQSAGGCTAICLSCPSQAAATVLLRKTFFNEQPMPFSNCPVCFRIQLFFLRFFEQTGGISIIKWGCWQSYSNSDFCFDLNQKSAFIRFSKPSFSAILQCRILKNHLENKNWVSWDFLFLISHLSSSLFQEWNLDSCCHLASLTYSAAVLVFRVVKVCKMLEHHLDWVQVLNNGEYIY